MSLQGTVETTAHTIKSEGVEVGTRTVVLNWTAQQDIDKNTSTISWSLKSGGTASDYYYAIVSELKVTLTIDGTDEVLYYRSSSYHTNCYNGTLLKSGTKTIKHKDDGTRSFTLKVEAGIYTWTINKSGTQTFELDTIKRASTVDSLSCNTSYFNGTLTYTCTKQNSKHYNKFNLSLNLGETYKTIATEDFSDDGGTIQLSEAELYEIYEALPTSTTGTLRLAVRTYSDASYSNQIGNESYKEITLTIPESVKPSIGHIDLSSTDGSVFLVQGKSRIRVKISGAAGTGSIIQSYTVSGPGISLTTSSDLIDSEYSISISGALTYTVTVTDGRGRTSSDIATITSYAYAAPYFASFSAYRCNSIEDETFSDRGECVKCEYTIGYSDVNDTNDITVKVHYKKNDDNLDNYVIAQENTKATSGKTLLGNISTDSTYTIYATIEDNYGEPLSSKKITIFSSERILNIRASKRGIAFGKMAEEDDLFECKWDAKFDGDLMIGTSTQSSTPTTGIKIHDVRNAEIKPGSFGDQNTNFYLHEIDGNLMSTLHMKGLAGNNAAWELAGNAADSSNDDTLKYRQGIGDVWGEWQTVITNQNIDTYVDDCLPLDGSKALTGQLTLSAGKAINFDRSDGYLDTLYATAGTLMFHPKRGANAVLGGSTVIHSGLTYNELYNGTLTDGSITFNYGKYREYIIIGQPAANFAHMTICIPKNVISTEDVKYQIADESYYCTFKLKYSGSTATLTFERSNSSGRITKVYGVY